MGISEEKSRNTSAIRKVLRAGMKRLFHIASGEEIKRGGVTDVYFLRDVEILERSKIDKKVIGEIRVATLPEEWRWAVLAGVEEALTLLEGLDVDLFTLDEGTFFQPEVPIMSIEGSYAAWGVFETALLGLLCQSSGIATRAARCKMAAQDRPVYSFGARRMHPAIAPMIERAAYIGGCDGVSATVGADVTKTKAVGTMPHAFIIAVGNEREAFAAFDRFVDPDVRRIALIDTFNDEKFGALIAVEALGARLDGVRLDTPRSRRGDFLKIAQEVRWELDLRDCRGVKIFASGGIDEESIESLNCVIDAYGVGGYISSAPIVDFSMDIVEVEGRPLAKRGKMSGAKQVWRCSDCAKTFVLPRAEVPDTCCDRPMEPLLKKAIDRGTIISKPPEPTEIREFVLKQFGAFDR